MTKKDARKRSFMDYGPPLVPGIVVFAITTVAKIIVTANQTNIIINAGIRGYRTFSTTTTVFMSIAFVATIVILLLKLRAMKNDPANKPQPRSERPEAVLSTNRKMDADSIRGMLIHALEQHTHRVPQDIYDSIARCADLMDEMDKYQKKLSNLLNNNGADGFSDTEEVLDQVEQCICKNVRKVVNYISVADCGDEEDVRNINAKLDACISDSAKQLEQVKEFLFAMAEFLNKQGDEDTTPEKLEIYKELILKSINDEEET